MVLEAIRYEPGSESTPPVLHILDQLQLPHRTTFERIANCEEAHNAIKTMKVRGAPAIAIVAALALAVEIGTLAVESQLPRSAEDVNQRLSQRLDYLKTSRPTAVNLGDAVGKLKAVAEKASLLPEANGRSVAQAYIASAERMLVDDVSDNKAIGEHGARWIEANTTAGKKRQTDKGQELKVLTHCNTGYDPSKFLPAPSILTYRQIFSNCRVRHGPRCHTFAPSCGQSYKSILHRNPSIQSRVTFDCI